MVCGTGMNQCSLSINTHVDTDARCEHSLEVDFYANQQKILHVTFQHYVHDGNTNIARLENQRQNIHASTINRYSYLCSKLVNLHAEMENVLTLTWLWYFKSCHFKFKNNV